MSDESFTAPHARSGRDRGRPSSRVDGLVGVVMVIAVVVLALLMLRGCEADRDRSSATSGSKEIVPVNGMVADTGVISVWLDRGGEISEIVRIAGLENSTVTDLGGGRYVISVPPGTEETVVRLVADMRGVHDAGLVYHKAE